MGINMNKLKKLLDDGEGHTIFKTESVIKALKEAKFDITETYYKTKRKGLTLTKDNKSSFLVLTFKPTKLPKTKYDIVSWNGDSPDGVYDLDLIRGLIAWTGEKCEAGDYFGRGFQYRSYREWLKERGI
uniref:Uncharacterized protein n=2 Tax=viral metagenome TaxID=1070528 RepID=A0A6M3LNK9_9ZZZZ